MRAESLEPLESLPGVCQAGILISCVERRELNEFLGSQAGPCPCPDLAAWPQATNLASSSRPKEETGDCPCLQDHSQRGAGLWGSGHDPQARLGTATLFKVALLSPQLSASPMETLFQSEGGLCNATEPVGAGAPLSALPEPEGSLPSCKGQEATWSGPKEEA